MTLSTCLFPFRNARNCKHITLTLIRAEMYKKYLLNIRHHELRVKLYMAVVKSHRP